MENNDVNNFIASVTVDIVDLVNMDFLENNYIDYLENLQEREYNLEERRCDTLQVWNLQYNDIVRVLIFSCNI